MADRPAPPVFLEPEQSIALWSIRELQFEGVAEKTRHLVGFLPSKGTLRVTTPIKYFSGASLQITTSSGRLYHLIGHPFFNEDVEYTFKVWLQNNKVVWALDVTHEYFRRH